MHDIPKTTKYGADNVCDLTWAILHRELNLIKIKNMLILAWIRVIRLLLQND